MVGYRQEIDSPLNYTLMPARFGFEEQHHEFTNQYYNVVPSIIGEMEYKGALTIFDEDTCKLMFTCSTFASLSIRYDKLMMDR